MTSAEEVIAAGLEPRLGELPSGRRLRLTLDVPVVDPTTLRPMPGPHIAGWVERIGPDRVKVRLMPTSAGRDARALLDEGLLDVVPSRDSVMLVDGDVVRRAVPDARATRRPGRRLRNMDGDLQHERSRELIAWAARRNLRQEV